MNRLHRHTASCGDVAKHLQEELDYRLSSASYRSIRRHLEGCPNCAAYLDSLKKTVLLYRRYPDPRVPTRMRQKLVAVLKLSE